MEIQTSNYYFQMQPGKSIKKRLFQTLIPKSPKHTMFQQNQNYQGPPLRPKKLQEAPSTLANAKSMPMFQQGKVVLNQSPKIQIIRKKPKQVQKVNLSREARSMIEEGRNRMKANLTPHEIFNLYKNYPEMMQDFFYLNRVGHPYDYRIVTYAERNPVQYMTISSQGVTLYHDKEAQFLSQDQWIVDQKRYYALQKIYFFRQYKLCKNFRIWKNCMRRHYMRQMSGILKEHFFLTFQYPRKCLLKVKQYTTLLRDSLSFFPYEQMVRLTPGPFLQLMADYRTRTLVNGIANIVSGVTECLVVAVQQQLNNFRAQNKIQIQGFSEKKPQNKQGFLYSQQAILRKQYKRVYKLIKLADQMLQQAKIQMVMRCLEQLLQKIDELKTQQREPWISCSAEIAQTGQVTWQPDCPTLLDLFGTTIKDHLQCLNDNNHRIINDPLFKKYKEAQCGPTFSQEIMEKGLNVLIQNSSQYGPLLARIQAKLQQQFENTRTQETNLQTYINIYLNHRSLGDMGKIFDENTAVDLCTLVDQWKNNQTQMHRLPQEKRGQLLLYNYSSLRQKIIAVPKDTLTYFFSLLPQQTSQRCQQLIKESKALLQMISVYPAQIFAFATYTRAVKNASDRLDDIRSSGSQICLLIDLMAKNRLGNLQLYNSKKTEALGAIAALKSKVQQSQARQNQSLSKFKKDNESQVIRIKQSVKELTGKFNSIDYGQIKITTRQMKEILNRIREVLPAITALQTQSNRIQSIEEDLNLPTTDFKEIHELYQNASLVHQIWTCRDQWKTMLVTLYHQHYCDVDCSQARSQWQGFSNQIATLSKIVPLNEILKNISQELGEVQILLEVISALRSPNLDEKSWKQISEYLGYELGVQSQGQLPFTDIRNPSYTVKWLLQINIPVYKQKIQFIVRKSFKQRELGQHLTEYKNFLLNLTFELVTKKREVSFFDQNKQNFNKISSNMSQLYGMLKTHFSPNIKHQAETLIRHYQYMQQIIRAVLQFGIQWNRYEPFFDNCAPSMKQLTKQSKEFANWQNQWKKIIKNITTDSALFYKRICDQTTGINCSRSTMKQILKLTTAIEQIKKGLDQYLDKKRSSFPKYYFIDDETLLGMLAKVDHKEPITAFFVPIIYKHIEKILYKQDTKDTITAILGKNGQEFALKPANFKFGLQMQDIFKITQQQIRKRMTYLMRYVFDRYVSQEISRKNMILENNLQVVLAVDMISWARLGQETYLSPEPIGDLYDWLEVQLAQIKQTRALLTQPQKSYIKHKLTQVFSQSIYLRQSTQQLLKTQNVTLESYQWQRIPKLCMSQANSQVYYRHLNSRINYCYEYLGNGQFSFLLPETQRIWLNLAQALTAKDSMLLSGRYRFQTIKELAFMVGQELDYVHLGQESSHRHVQQFINVGMSTGNWLCFDLPSTPSIMAFLAHQLNQIKKASTQISTDKNKSTFISPNTAFFLLNSQSNCSAFESLMVPLSYRSLTVLRPNMSKLFSVLGDSLCGSSQIGTRVYQICELVRDCFQSGVYPVFTQTFTRQIIQSVSSITPNYQWLKNLKCKQYLQFIIFQAIDLKFLPVLRNQDVSLYENLKQSFIPEYQKLKYKKIEYKREKNTNDLHQIQKFLVQNSLSSMNKSDYTKQLQQLITAIDSSTLGVIVTGQILSGKTTIIDLAAKYIQKRDQISIKQDKIYHQAYSPQEVFGLGNSSSLIKHALNSEKSSTTWVILDGDLSSQYCKILSGYADKFVLPQVGTISSRKSLKFIQETCDISKLEPSLIGNHSLITLPESLLNSQLIIQKLFSSFKSKNYLSGLQASTIHDLIQSFSSVLAKVQHRNIFKSRSINLIYNTSNLQITNRCCRLIQSVFAMNWQSIRERQKGMKKIIERLVGWVLYWALCGLVVSQDSAKLQKLVTQLCRSDSNEEWGNCIIYPGCGFQVQPINGLRTQSTLNIPQKGIITNTLRSDLLADSDPQKNNKFYEEIVISESRLIRVNYTQSIKMSYVSQLISFTSTTLLMLGPANTGKKTLIEIYAKNMRNKTQFYPLRYKNRQSLPSQLERPFKKVIGFQGATLRTTSASKQLLISIQDVSLNESNLKSVQFMRMLLSESGYYSSGSEWLTLSNFSLMLIGNRVGLKGSVLRLLPKMQILQTQSNNSEKLNSIYAPYLRNWATFNGLSGQVSRIFNSQNGDSLLDATLQVFKFMQQLSKTKMPKDSLQAQLARPKIADISKVLNYICKTPQANHYHLGYYYQLWVHQIVRVFGDRLRPQYQDMLFNVLKKQSLLKFKENLLYTPQDMYWFSSLGIQNQNCYIRIEDPSFLHSHIRTLVQADQINVPLKFIFDQLLQHVLKIYRIMASQGSHLLLLGSNKQTSMYLIKLGAQIGQNLWYKLGQQGVSVQKHIEPALYDKNQICLINDVDSLSQQNVYQISCLLNYNFYDFVLNSQLKDKIRVNLNRKQKPQLDKKDSRVGSKSNVQNKQQKQQDIQAIMSQQFMNYAHFILYADPTSTQLKSFVKRQKDIMSCMCVNWVDIPVQSMVQVAKQILTFDQENAQSMAEVYSDDLLIKKSKDIYGSLKQNDQYFNSMLTVCQIVKLEYSRLGKTLNQRQSRLKQGKANMDKVRTHINTKNLVMNGIQVELDEINKQLQTLNNTLEEVNNLISETQMDGEQSSQAMSNLRIKRQEVDIQMKMIKQKKQKIEANKKKTLKSIKIGNDYFDMFQHSTKFFDQKLEKTSQNLQILQDTLIVVWSSICYLSTLPCSEWIGIINNWLGLMSSKIPRLTSNKDILNLFQQVSPISLSRWDLFSQSVRIKALSLLLLLHRYEQTNLYGHIPRVHDSQGMLKKILQQISREYPSYTLLQTFPKYIEQPRKQVQTLLKNKNGMIIIQRQENIDQLQTLLHYQKLSGMLNKIIVISSKQQADLIIDCDVSQLRLTLQQYMITKINPSMLRQQNQLFLNLQKENKKKNDNQQQLQMTCSNINLQSQTYTQQINKFRDCILNIENNIKTIISKIDKKEFYQFGQFCIVGWMETALESIWMTRRVQQNQLSFIFDQAVKIRTAIQFQTFNEQEKKNELVKIVKINLSLDNHLPFEEFLSYSRKIQGTKRLLFIQGTQNSLSALQASDKYKLVNLFLSNTLDSDGLPSEKPIILYNFDSNIHLSILLQLLQKHQNNNVFKYAPITIFSNKSQFKSIQKSAIKIVEFDLCQVPCVIKTKSFNQKLKNLYKILIKKVSNNKQAHKNLQILLGYLQNNLQLVKKQSDIAQLIFDFFEEIPQTTLNHLLFKMTDLELEATISKLTKQSKNMNKRSSLIQINLAQQISNVRQSVPYMFPINDLVPKDPVSEQIVKFCQLLNHKIKIISQKTKENSYEWQDNQPSVVTSKEINYLNNEYQLLKKNLSKLHLTSSTGIQKAGTSHHFVTSKSITVTSVVKLTPQQMSLKMLHVLKIKAAKKLKKPWGSIKLNWKILGQGFSFEDVGALPDLSLCVKGQLQSSEILESLMIAGNMKKHFQIIVFATDGTIQQKPVIQYKEKQLRQAKSSAQKIQIQLIPIPVMIDHICLGNVQFSSTELTSPYMSGIDHPFIELQPFSTD